MKSSAWVLCYSPSPSPPWPPLQSHSFQTPSEDPTFDSHRAPPSPFHSGLLLSLQLLTSSGALMSTAERVHGDSWPLCVFCLPWVFPDGGKGTILRWPTENCEVSEGLDYHYGLSVTYISPSPSPLMSKLPSSQAELFLRPDESATSGLPTASHWITTTIKVPLLPLRRPAQCSFPKPNKIWSLPCFKSLKDILLH